MLTIASAIVSIQLALGRRRWALTPLLSIAALLLAVVRNRLVLVGMGTLLLQLTTVYHLDDSVAPNDHYLAAWGVRYPNSALPLGPNQLLPSGPEPSVNKSLHTSFLIAAW